MSPKKKGGKAMKKLSWAVLAVASIACAAYVLMQTPFFQGGTAGIYFFKDGKLSQVKRPLPENVDPMKFVLEQLLAGPTAEEKASGLFSQIPEKTKLRAVRRKAGTVSADFTKDLEMYGGGTAKVYGSLEQIVYTLTALKGVKAVQILVEGRREVSLGSEGLIIDKPLTRKDVAP